MGRGSGKKGYGLTKRKGVWQVNYDHPTQTRERRVRLVDGSEVVERVPVRRFVTLKNDDGSPVTDRRRAEKMATELLAELVKARLIAKERGPQVEETLTQGERTRWPMQGSLQDYIASKAHPVTRVDTADTVRRFDAFINEKQLVYLDELTPAHGAEFRQRLADNPDIGNRTRDKHLSSAKAFLTWCVNSDRLAENPFKRKRLPGFTTKRARDRRLSKPIAIVFREQREQLFNACRTTQERLMFLLSTLLGLRPGEVIRLRWGDYKRHNEPPILTVMAQEEWQPKTGERMVPVIFPEVHELLETWLAETPFGTGDEEFIFRGRREGLPFKGYPQEFVKWLQQTGIYWTPTIGRHTACSILPLYTERLTHRRWNEMEHAQFFGHDFDTSKTYYITEQLFDLAAKEGLNGIAGDGTPSVTGDVEPAVEERLKGQGLDLDLARELLDYLMTSKKRSRLSLAKAIGISDVAIRKFQTQGKSVPLWFYPVLRELLR